MIIVFIVSRYILGHLVPGGVNTQPPVARMDDDVMMLLKGVDGGGFIFYILQWMGRSCI